MTITLGALIIMLVISALVGIAGEFIAHRRAPFGIIGAIILGFIATFLVTEVFHWGISGEPVWGGVPIVTSIIAAAVLVFIWSMFAYRHAYGYYRRGGYARRPRRFW